MGQDTAVIGYCMKCKKKQAIKDAKDVVMKNGKPAKQGPCSVCGTKVFKIVGGIAIQKA